MRCNGPFLAAKLADDIVGQGGNLGVRVGVTEGRHEHILIAYAHFHSLQNGLSHVRAADVVYPARADQRSIG